MFGIRSLPTLLRATRSPAGLAVVATPVRAFFGPRNEGSGTANAPLGVPGTAANAIRFPRGVEASKGAFVGNFPTPDATLDGDDFHNRVPYLRPDDDIVEASQLLRKYDVGCVPVLAPRAEGAGASAGGSAVKATSSTASLELVGMLSERDIARWVGTAPAEALLRRGATEGSAGTAPTNPTVADIMSTPVVSCGENTPLNEALTIMDKNNFRHLPVLSATGELIGLLSMRDIMHRHVSGKPQQSNVDDFMAWVLKMSS